MGYALLRIPVPTALWTAHPALAAPAPQPRACQITGPFQFFAATELIWIVGADAHLTHGADFSCPIVDLLEPITANGLRSMRVGQRISACWVNFALVATDGFLRKPNGRFFQSECLFVADLRRSRQVKRDIPASLRAWLLSRFFATSRTLLRWLFILENDASTPFSRAARGIVLRLSTYQFRP
jgi:hypothetical protein